MSKGSAKLIFFCQLCNAPIDSNICKVHGIDFVTIKKIYDDGPKAKSPTPGTNGIAPLQSQSATSNPADTRLARPEGLTNQEYLPAVPGELEDQPSSLPAIPEDEVPTADAGPNLPNLPEDAVEDLPEEVLEEMHPETEAEDFTQTEIPFKQMDPEVPEYYEQVGGAKKAVKKGSTGKILGALAGVLTVAAIAAAAYFFYLQAPATPDALYKTAESELAAGNTAKAQTLYEEITTRFPSDPLASMAQNKLSQLALSPEEATPTPPAVAESGNEKIRELMLKANIAFRQKQYLLPEEDNAIKHIRAVLAAEPSYQPALDLQSQIIEEYNQQVETELAAGNRMKAIGALKNIHSITDDPAVLERILAILSQN